jgi:antitoxin component of MazEF toxin-antitoxin module
MTVTVKKVGGSLAVIIPNALAREWKLSEGTALSITTTADLIVMRKQGRRPRRSVREIVAGINPATYRRRRERELGWHPARCPTP